MVSSPQIINGMNCGFPENYKIYVGLRSPIASPFAFEDDTIPAGFRGVYSLAGLEPNTTYYVDVQGGGEPKLQHLMQM